MVRFLFWSLLLINGGLLAYNLGWLGKFSLDTHEPERLKKQHHTEQISLLSASAVQELLDAEQAREQAEAEAEAEKNKPVKDAPAPAKPEIFACLELGSYALTDGARVEDKLRSLNFGARQQRQTVMETAAHMVYIPPQGSKENADKKAAELRRRGIEDFFIVQDNSPMRWAISLGVFKTEEAAKNHLANLNAQGVRTARIGPRSVTASKYNYQFKNLNSGEKQKLEQVATQLGSGDLHECRR